MLRVDIPVFEGPLDLLLELIREHELDIFDIPIALICRKYLEYIDTLEQLDLDLGAEWLEMASRLMHMKSKLLLPSPEDEEDQEDPRKKLAWQLIQHKKYKLVLDKLDDIPQLERDVFTGDVDSQVFREQTGPPEVENAEAFKLLTAIQRLIEDRDETEQMSFSVATEPVDIARVADHLVSQLEQQSRITFREVVSEIEPTRPYMIGAFLVILEMVRLDLIRLAFVGVREEVLQIESLSNDFAPYIQDLRTGQFGGTETQAD